MFRVGDVERGCHCMKRGGKDINHGNDGVEENHCLYYEKETFAA